MKIYIKSIIHLFSALALVSFAHAHGVRVAEVDCPTGCYESDLSGNFYIGYGATPYVVMHVELTALSGTSGAVAMGQTADASGNLIDYEEIALYDEIGEDSGSATLTPGYYGFVGAVVYGLAGGGASGYAKAVFSW